MRFTKLSDNFIIVRQVENVKWKFVTVCRWHSAGKASGAVWRHVELVWTYRGATCQQASWLNEIGMSNGVLSLLINCIEENA
jgi:hypothetical protein